MTSRSRVAGSICMTWKFSVNLRNLDAVWWCEGLFDQYCATMVRGSPGAVSRVRVSGPLLNARMG